MEQPLYHVVLGDRRVGPYDRRTIVGMRMKKALASKDVLIDSQGVELTVGTLIARRSKVRSTVPQRASSCSVVLATYTASVVGLQRGEFRMPAFHDAVQVRVQGDVLRIAGRFRHWLRWRDDRVKLPLPDVAQVQVAGSRVVLWVRGHREGAALQRLELELFEPESALALARWLPASRSGPAQAARSQPRARSASQASSGLRAGARPL